jgi:putative membrane protein
MFTATTTIIASHGDGWGHYDGPGPWIPFVFLVFWLSVIALVAWRFRRGGPPWARHDGQSVLADRYARGDISAEEYRERRDVLKEQTR